MNINNLWMELGLKEKVHRADALEINTILAARYLVGPAISMNGAFYAYEGFDLETEARVIIYEYFPYHMAIRNAETGTVLVGFGHAEKFRRGLAAFVEDARFMHRFSAVPALKSVRACFYENDTAYTIRERLEGISLGTYLRQNGGRISEYEALQFLKPVMEALIEVHKAGYYHGELACDCIYLSKTGKVSLGGLERNRKLGKNIYTDEPVVLLTDKRAPEQFSSNGKIGTWTDVYGMSAVLYRVLSGKEIPAMSDRYMGTELLSLKSFGVNENTEKVISEGLALDVKQRIQTVTELMKCLDI